MEGKQWGAEQGVFWEHPIETLCVSYRIHVYPCLVFTHIYHNNPPKCGVDIPVPRIPWRKGLDGSSDSHARRPNVSCDKFIFKSLYDGRQVFWRFANLLGRWKVGDLVI